jgi:hypothetical protein
MPFDFHTRTEHLTALFDHLLPLGRIINDIAVFEREIVLPQHCANALTPPAGGFQISDNFRFVHILKFALKLPHLCRLAIFSSQKQVGCGAALTAGFKTIAGLESN